MMSPDSTARDESPNAQTPIVLTRAFVIVRRTKEAWRSPGLMRMRWTPRSAEPSQTSPAQATPEPGRFVFEAPRTDDGASAGARFTLEAGDEKWSDEQLGLPDGLPAGRVCYVDLD